PYALTTVLNSRYLSHYLNIKFKDKHLAGGYLAINKSTLEELPIVKIDNPRAFRMLYFYLENLLNDKLPDVNNFVPNSHIAQLFEEVIDAMVMELYFKEDFEKAGIAFIKYAVRDFESIEGKTEPEQIEIIHRAYQKLREKDNEIRNNLKLMDIKLADIVMPIKAAN